MYLRISFVMSFNGIVSNSQRLLSNEWMVNNELGRIWKEEVLV
jgi:hypothetical protein